MDEQDINKKNREINFVLMSGLVLLALFSAGLSVFIGIGSKLYKIFGLLLTAVVVASCLILLDSFRRLRKAQLENKTIRKKTVIVFVIAYLSEAISIVC
jgi:uncharacterized membrane-anchored protein